MSVAKAAWVGSYFTCFSIKFDATNDKSSKDENSKSLDAKNSRAYWEIFRVPVGHPTPARKCHGESFCQKFSCLAVYVE